VNTDYCNTVGWSLTSLSRFDGLVMLSSQPSWQYFR